MLAHIQRKHDITCWTIAIGLHLLLLRVNFNLYNKVDEAKKLIPVVEVEYITQEEIISTRIARMPGRPPQTFKEKLKHFFSKEIVPEKKEVVLAAKAPERLKVEKVKGLSAEKALVDKRGSLTRKVDLSPGDSSKEKLISREEEERILLGSKEIGLKDFKSEKIKDKDYRVARKDLPFQVSTGEEIMGKGVDTVAINLGKKTSKEILTEAPGLKDIKGKGELGKGVFKVVKKEEGEKLSGTEVLANLLAIAKEEEAKKWEGYGSGMGTGEALAGEKVGSGGGVLKEVKGEEEGKEKIVRKGVVFTPARVGKKEEAKAETGIEEEEEARREQRGRVIFEIRGPLSQRKILRKIIPSYPEWAEKEGVEAGVSIHFVVLSDGKVKDNIYVVKTSGYPGIDKLVMETLREWQFASLKGDLYGKEEWGVLTFYFTLDSKLAQKG